MGEGSTAIYGTLAERKSTVIRFWQLLVHTIDVNGEKINVSVSGNMTVGSVMVKLIHQLPDNDVGWADFGLWWPARNMWLTKANHTLDGYGAQNGTELWFTSMHKSVCLHLPDLQVVPVVVDFSCCVFDVVARICKMLRIRHPEELSLWRPRSQGLTKLDSNDRRSQRLLSSDKLERGSVKSSDSENQIKCLDAGDSNSTLRRRSRGSLSGLHTFGRKSVLSHESLNASDLYSTLPSSRLNRSIPGVSPGSVNSHYMSFGSGLQRSNSGSDSTPFLGTLATSPAKSLKKLLREFPAFSTSLENRAKFNCGWFDTWLCLMEQNVSENADVFLRFKFNHFHDLSPRMDVVRLNQLYEQTTLSHLLHSDACDEQQAVAYAALMLHIRCLSSNQQNAVNGNQTFDSTDGNGVLSMTMSSDASPVDGLHNMIEEHDEIDAELDDLKCSLDDAANVGAVKDTGNQSFYGASATVPNALLTNVPVLDAYIKYLRPRKWTLSRYKTAWFCLSNFCLARFTNQDEARLLDKPRWNVCLKGCRVSSEVSSSLSKLTIRVILASASIASDDVVFDSSEESGANEIYLRFDSPELYARWLAAFRLASCGHTMANVVSYKSELKHLQIMLPVSFDETDVPDGKNPHEELRYSLTEADVDLDELLPADIIKKGKTKKLIHRILTAVEHIRYLNVGEAKLSFIQAWQRVPTNSYTYFVVQMRDKKKPEVIAVCPEGVCLLHATSGETRTTLQYKTLKEWNINAVNGKVRLVLSDNSKLSFQVLSCDAKVFCEFMGGYIFLSLRTASKNDTFDTLTFHKLTGAQPG